MKRPTLLHVSISTTPEAEDAVADALGELSGQPASIYHHLDTGESMVSVYLAPPVSWTPTQRTRMEAAVQEIRRCGLDTGSGRLRVQRLKHEDWADAWKRHFQPITIGRVLLIRPSWSKRRAVPGQATMILDPGLSFGTGQHPTTRFCLEQLVAHRNSGERARQSFLDIGTGSGILAIAAAKLGYTQVEAFDFDPESVRVARENARRNRVLPQIRFSQRDLCKLPVRPPRMFQVVCANLTSDLLLSQQTRLLSRVKPGGALVLAGILGTQFPEVARAYEAAGWRLAKTRAIREWQSGLFYAD